MFRRAFSLAAVIAALTAQTALAQSSTKLFKPGSLIIPQSAVFQTGCGSVSAYGLIYRLLLENQSGGRFWQQHARHHLLVDRPTQEVAQPLLAVESPHPAHDDAGCNRGQNADGTTGGSFETTTKHVETSHGISADSFRR